MVLIISIQILMFLTFYKELIGNATVAKLSFFLLGRILDDISWYQVNISNEQDTFQGTALVALLIAIMLNFIRKWEIDGILKIMFFQSQIKFFIPWSLQILIVILFLNTFSCQSQTHSNEESAVNLSYQSCCLNSAQLILTNVTYSLAVNTKTDAAELIVYELMLFSEIIFDARLWLGFIFALNDKQKDLSLVLMSTIIANQVLIMDLIFRWAFQKKKLKKSEQKLVKDLSLVYQDMRTTIGKIQADRSPPQYL